MRFSTLSCLFLPSVALAQGDLVALLQSQPDLSTLLELVSLVPGLAETLSDSSNITILAPTNSAFDNVPSDIPEGEAILNRNVTTVEALLSNHVIRGSYPSSAITEVPAFLQTLIDPSLMNERQPFTNTTGGQYLGAVKNGQDVNILSGEFTVSKVVIPDIKLGDGITIHVIDTAVLFGAPFQLYAARAGLAAINNAAQAAGIDNSDGVDVSSIFNYADRTFFVPTNEAFELIASVANNANQQTLQDVLSYHIIEDNIVFSPSITNTTVPTAQGNDITLSVLNDGSMFVNNAKVVFPNIILWNGVAHLIDNVLNPAAPAPDRATLNVDTPASERIEFPDAQSDSLDFTTYPVLTGESYTIPPLLSTVLPVIPPSATAGPSPPAFTGAAAVPGVPVIAAGIAAAVAIMGHGGLAKISLKGFCIDVVVP